MVRRSLVVAVLAASQPVLAQDQPPPEPAPRAPVAAPADTPPDEAPTDEAPTESAPADPIADEGPPEAEAASPPVTDPPPHKGEGQTMVELRPPDAYPPAAAAPPPPVTPAPTAPPPSVLARRPVPQPQLFERRNPAMMIAGIVLTGVGAVAAVAGAALVGRAEEGADCGRAFGSLEEDGGCDPSRIDPQLRNAGIGAGLAGLALIGAGIPLTVVGARQVPVESAWLPTIRVGPTAGQLRWSF